MIAFTSGSAMIFAVLCATAIFSESLTGRTGWILDAPVPRTTLSIDLFLLPTLTSFLALDALNRWRARRWLDVRARRRWKVFLLGVASALLAAAAIAFLLAWLGGDVPAWVLISGPTLLTTTGAFFCMPRRRPGHCVHCAYDLRDAPAHTRCPECGSLDPV